MPNYKAIIYPLTYANKDEPKGTIPFDDGCAFFS